MRYLCLLLVVVVGVGLASWLSPARWSPYVAGAVIGVLSCLALFISDKPLGTSTTHVRLSGFIARLFSPKAVDENAYYQETGIKVEWQMMLVFGIFLAALISALLSGSFELRWLPDGWRAAFGTMPLARVLIAFLGGLLVAFGARWADGCSSGHGISGTVQMSVAGWVATICFFVGGVVTALVLYGPGGMVQ